MYKCAPFFCDLPQIENEYSLAINLVENSGDAANLLI
ncbi:hypothetical protein Asd1617_04408 [Shigella dysenteriae 1617]|uniref:Uncharacterized protein n=1 Tax=Shigella dysenteriae 1617 TaxID=754093 RepID=A0A0A6ZZ69_SHIDY|nr:hypothetical protein Asd1617_04408 [Shigella dysenteriae 1617]